MAEPVTHGAASASVRAEDTRRFAADLPDLLRELPDYRGQSYYAPSELTMGIIADDVDCEYFQDAIHLVRLTPEGWEELLPELDLVLYVTCRDGGGFGGKDGRARAAEALRAARAAGVPTAFWSTADPAGFEDFLPVAAAADFVFTVDEDRVGEYRRRLDGADVSYLGWGVSPAVSNPIGFLRRLDGATGAYARDAFFADSWPEGAGRPVEDAQRIFDGVLEAEDGRRLFIADEGGSALPERSRPCVMESLSKDEARKAQKLFHFAICLNAAPSSRTACSRQVYEAQAQGNVVLCTYSSVVSNDFLGLFTIIDADEVVRIMAGYTEEELVAMGLEGLRRMYTGNTVFDRLGELLGRMNLGSPFLEHPVHVIVDEVDAEAEAFLAGQRCAGARLVAAHDAVGLDDGFAVRLHAPYPASPTFLVDLVDAFKFSDAAWSAYAPSYAGAYEYADGPAPDGPVMVDLSRVPAASLLSGAVPEGAEGFLVVEPRWGRATAETPKELAVILPIYNNGAFLWGRSFRSLLRSSAFDRMQVYLVDDGSKDGETERIVHGIAAAFDNVMVFCFGDGGSGSAARPRNKGLELADEPFVTFLDPDNEAVGDGYARLLDAMRGDDVDLAYGMWLQIDGNGALRRNGAIRRFGFGSEGDRRVDDAVGELLDTDFATLNPQSCVIRRDFIEDAGLSFLEGGVAEDTLFGYELMLNAKAAERREFLASVYWSDREDSLTNDIGAGYFANNLVTHRRQVKVLAEHGLVDEYRARHLDRYLDKWLLPLLGRVPLDELPEAACYLRELVQLYDGEDVSRLKERHMGDAKKAADARIRSLRSAKAASDRKAKRLSGRLESSQTEVKQLRAENKKLSAEVRDLRSSNSWRIGRAITWLPRKIKALFKRLRRG